MDGTYETKLLRLLIGLLHISVTEQAALLRYSTPFHKLPDEQQESLQTELVAGALKIAEALSEKALQAGQPPISLSVN